MEIRNDDEIVLNGEALPIRNVSVWDVATDRSLREAMTETISICRAPAMVQGKRAKDATLLYTNVACTPLMPNSGQIQIPSHDAPALLFEIFLDDATRVIHLVVERVDLKKTNVNG